MDICKLTHPALRHVHDADSSHRVASMAPELELR